MSAPAPAQTSIPAPLFGQADPPGASGASLPNAPADARADAPDDENSRRESINMSPQKAHPFRAATEDTERDKKAMLLPLLPRTKAASEGLGLNLQMAQEASQPETHSPSRPPGSSQNTAVPSLDPPGTKAETEAGGKERPPLAPFFTLISSALHGEQSTHHPSRVHYVFSDDEDSEVLTAALLRSSGIAPDEGGAAGEEEEEGARTRGPQQTPTHAHPATGENGKARGKDGEREERIVIVDINETGDGVTRVRSLAPSWAVVSAEIGKAPTWDGAEGEDEGGREGGLMLRIEGVDEQSVAAGISGSVGGKGKGKEAEAATGVSEDEMQALLESFDRKMGVLRRVVRLGSRESLGGEAEKR
ncbi:hypothetical protein QTJ16_007002 [Diplocarpon rosae]|uniref:Uncharacterized protein n=1 Tax=Diplocarpon rosae TaxID=946125 RepID=A0AAD9WBZ4_9HELO|nr:hypothetical protein QTJ16_007002 [Diplocarpon rosae]